MSLTSWPAVVKHAQAWQSKQQAKLGSTCCNAAIQCMQVCQTLPLKGNVLMYADQLMVVMTTISFMMHLQGEHLQAVIASRLVTSPTRLGQYKQHKDGRAGHASVIVMAFVACAWSRSQAYSQIRSSMPLEMSNDPLLLRSVVGTDSQTWPKVSVYSLMSSAKSSLQHLVSQTGTAC